MLQPLRTSPSALLSSGPPLPYAVARPWLTGDQPPVPAAVADSPDDPAVRTRPAILGHRARDRAWLGGASTGRPNGARRGPAHVESEIPHRSLLHHPAPADDDRGIDGRRSATDRLRRGEAGPGRPTELSASPA